MRKATFLFSMKSPEGHKLPLNEFALESWLKRIVSVHSGDIRHAKVDKVTYHYFHYYSDHSCYSSCCKDLCSHTIQ